jgi:hypothetical protein
MGVPGVLARETTTNHVAEIEKFLGIEGESARAPSCRGPPPPHRRPAPEIPSHPP